MTPPARIAAPPPHLNGEESLDTLPPRPKIVAMPVRFHVYHPEKMVVGVTQGVVTLKHIICFALDIAQNRASTYRKIVDVVSGTPMLSEADFAAYRDRLRELPPDQRPSGPLALVTNEEHGPLARLFAELTGGERPAKVFTSIHAARQWLRGQPGGSTG